MTELMAVIKLNEWLFLNKITTCNFISFVGHEKNESIYGQLFETEKGLLFQRHKWIEINKEKPPPKVYAGIHTIFVHPFFDIK